MPDLHHFNVRQSKWQWVLTSVAISGVSWAASACGTHKQGVAKRMPQFIEFVAERHAFLIQGIEIPAVDSNLCDGYSLFEFLAILLIC
ncbi:hypothetical protein [Chitinibacter sp. S2-10]|uniref:hypothetical protein n=1 Tax=Chitinibacter sp. S2-10 TaxID=3373597 RepID=UPI0039778695